MRVILKEEIVQKLREVGLERGDAVMVHTSLKRMGYVCGGAVISAFGLYQPLVDWGGSGATVPLSGFGHMMAQGAIEGAQEGFLAAIGGGLKAGAIGISVAVIMGVVIAAVFNPKG